MANKHAELMSTERNGVSTFRLLCSDPLLCEFFDSWVYQLAKVSHKTAKTYANAVLRFINYISEIAVQQNGLTPILIMNALADYESFLAFGVESESGLAANAARGIGFDSCLSGSSITTHFAAVNRFIEASENLRIALLELEANGYIDDANASMLPITITKYITTPPKIKAAIKSKSWLAGCIAGGYKKIKIKGLKPISKAKTTIYADEFGGDDKTFPIDKCRELIESAPNLRDKTLWSLIAASGIRYTEAATVTLADIDTKSRKVVIIDPDTRRNIFKNYLTESQLNKLDHKGRTHPETFLIEPFNSMFWCYFAEYIESEYKKEKDRGVIITHPFVFRDLKNGKPLLNSYQTLYESFHKVAKSVTARKYGFHSLRHMYGYYLANFCPNPYPRPDQPFGLPLEYVQKFMGHTNLSMTARYGRKDMFLMESLLATANMLRLENPAFSVVDQRIKYLENQLNQMKLEQQKQNLLIKGECL